MTEVNWAKRALETMGELSRLGLPETRIDGIFITVTWEIVKPIAVLKVREGKPRTEGEALQKLDEYHRKEAEDKEHPYFEVYRKRFKEEMVELVEYYKNFLEGNAEKTREMQRVIGGGINSLFVSGCRYGLRKAVVYSQEVYPVRDIYPRQFLEEMNEELEKRISASKITE